MLLSEIIMNVNKIIFLCLAFLFFNMNRSYAQITIINSSQDTNAASYGQLKLENGKEFFMVSSKELNTQSIELFALPDTKHRTEKIAFPYLPMFILPFQATDLIIGANASGVWYASKLTSSIKVSNQIQLRDFESVSSAITTTTGYMISGISQSGKPLVIELSKNLVETQRSRFQDGLTGEAVIVSRSKTEAIIVLNLENGQSSIAWLSNGLVINRLAGLKGGATCAVSTEKGIAVTYSVGKNVVFEESKWSKVLFQRDGPSTLKFQIIPIKTGFGIIGANKSTLVFVKIDTSGAESNIFVDKSGFLPPTENSYSVIVNPVGVHVFGVAHRKDASKLPAPIRFHLLI
jgi:hypothetical protein